ncbi:hypothetical protein BDZ94DRAFT_381931 [Collybia nuda]|uniref:Transmembrane protein n=1 Tax=Collybia nuda TaxID=64659 RepID=A0A9P5YIS3_9AGAR|nr:hypothetical protein BDZ94DRAFT_381931 [Collybia nuda]
MAIIIPKLTVAQAATIINAIITFLQYSISLILIALLLYFIPTFNSANSWSVAARQVHTSFWSAIFRTTRTHASARVKFFSKLSPISALLVAICGIVTPLGLRQGSPTRSHFRTTDASFVKDTSPLGLATSPRQGFKFSRSCGGISRNPICPGNTPETINRTEIPPSVFEKFSSTPHGPFNMEFRRYFDEGNKVSAEAGVVQSVILQEGIFAVEGMVIDMTETPGIGLINHTIPGLEKGATWSQDVFWLEPATTCVDTNLTIDYIRRDEFGIEEFNLTDRGGFVNLPTEPPVLPQGGQHINLWEYAYRAAFLVNNLTMMRFNNMSRNDSHVGKTYLLNMSMTTFIPGDISIGNPSFNLSTTDSPETPCATFSEIDNANISTVAVWCGGVTGPARRTDGGDERLPSINSTWSQTIHVCASATRASIQTLTFTLNSTRELSDLQITRKANNTPILWAAEKTNLKIGDLDLFWGHVADKYESDPSLSTLRSNVLYVPAGDADISGGVAAGEPSTVPAGGWNSIYGFPTDFIPDYSGKNNFALLAKWQSLLDKDPENGTAQIRNLIWTDFAVNSLVGTTTYPTLLVASLEPSVTYDLRFGIPLLILLIIWVPAFIASTFLLVFGFLRIAYIRDFLDHTAAGRLSLGHSVLSPTDTHENSNLVHLNEKDWQKVVGNTIVPFRSVNNIPKKEEAYAEPHSSEIPE